MEKLGVYAVIRVDNYLLGGSGADVAKAITVKEILPTAEEAEREVARLNELNANKGSHYFLQYTRYFPSGRSGESD